MATLEDNIRWVQDFNLNLGVNVLGGIFGVVDAFAEPVKMLEEFFDLIEYGEELRRKHGSKTKAFEEAIRPYLYQLDSRLGSKQFEIVSVHYVPFYYEAKVRLEACPKFIEWVKGSTFSIMPDIFTKSVMEYAISKIEIREKIARVVSDSLIGQLLETTQDKPEESKGEKKNTCGKVLFWIGAILRTIGWVGVVNSIFIMLNSPVGDGTWFVWLLFSVFKIVIGSILRGVSRRMGFIPGHHPVLGAIVGGFGILLSIVGWLGVAAFVRSLVSERSTIDPLSSCVASIALLVFGSVFRYKGRRMSGPPASTNKPKD